MAADSASRAWNEAGFDALERAYLNHKPDQCRWPFGHPMDTDFRLCAETRAAGHKYCAKHKRLSLLEPDKVDGASPNKP